MKVNESKMERVERTAAIALNMQQREITVGHEKKRAGQADRMDGGVGGGELDLKWERGCDMSTERQGLHVS